MSKTAAKLAKQRASRLKKEKKAPLRVCFKDAFFYTKRTPKDELKGHKIGQVKLLKVHDAASVDPKAAALLNTGTLQWFAYQTKNIDELRGKKFDKATIKNVAAITRYFESNVAIDEMKSDFAKVTVAITTERTSAFNRAYKAWKKLKLKCQDIADDYGSDAFDSPLVGFRDAKRKKPGALGQHIKVINKFFQQYAKYVTYRAKWKEAITKKETPAPVVIPVRPQLSFQAEADSDSSGIGESDSDSESDEEESETTKDSAKKVQESAKSSEDSENSDSDSGESSEESAAKEPPKAAAKASAQKSDSDSSDSSSEEEAKEYELADGTTVYVDSAWNAYNEDVEKVGVVNPKTKTLKRTKAAARKSKSAANARVKATEARLKKNPPDGKKQAQLIEDAKVAARKEEIDMLKKRKFKRSGNQNDFALLYKRGFTADQVQEIMEAQRANGYYSEGDPSLDDASSDSDEDARRTLLKETGNKKKPASTLTDLGGGHYKTKDGSSVINVEEAMMAKVGLSYDGPKPKLAERRTPKPKTDRTPKPKTDRTPESKTKKRTHEQDNKRSSNKKNKKRRKKHKKSTGSAATP